MINFNVKEISQNLKASSFGTDFLWGTSIAAVQNEGAHNSYGKGPSIWDTFSRLRGKIKGNHNPSNACDFYHRYKEDLLLAKALGFKVFRFSLSWARIIPEGFGKINKEGLAFYHRVIDECLKLEMIPFLTIYHWDLPAALEKEGGWTSHMIVKWFSRFSACCAEAFGDKVKHWIILNEPFGFTSLGYMLGKHAPGKKGLNNFLPAIHHVALAQAEGARMIRQHVSNAYIGTTFSCSEVIPYSQKEADIAAAKRVDILLNRLFVEPALGTGYPREDFRFLDKLQLYSWKYTDKMHFAFDFIGVQNYFPVVIKYNPVIPIIQAVDVKASSRKVPHTAMGWEINADSFYNIIKQFWSYEGVKEIIITENGAAFKDKLVNAEINDGQRIDYFKEHIKAMHRAKQEGVNIKGYFAWTLMDNFEWSEGYRSRFGLIHVDFRTQMRTIKNSGYWFRDFLKT